MQNNYSNHTTRARFPNRIAARIWRILSVVTVVAALHSGGLLLADEREESKVEELVQEVFHGEIVYPQDRGELQFTTGYLYANKGNNFLWGSEGEDDFELPLIFEYGLTDYIQVAAVIPVNFLRTGLAETEGVGNVELECYYNFYNNRRSGRAYGMGIALGLPPATSEIGEEALFYEPFFVAYQKFDSFAVNFSANLEIEDPLSADDETEVGGDFDLAFIRKYNKFSFLMELNTEIDPDETLVRLAPGMYWQPRDNFELGVSLPIGLTDDTPDLGVFVLVTWEFGGRDRDED